VAPRIYNSPLNCILISSIDRELADEFDAYAEWEYWADVNGTIEMTREEVGLLADTEGAVFYTTLEWHVIHCM
jgi:hypothetical protein